uniref:Uncharacterized protein n=1 Tax=Wuchereria bancrofti TaxID=6293 RepID=A0A1I8EXC8_WUCBA
MLFGIPISAAIDIIFRHMTATSYFIIGTLLILFSCVIVIVPPELFHCSMKKKKECAKLDKSKVNKILQ